MTTTTTSTTTTTTSQRARCHIGRQTADHYDSQSRPVNTDNYYNDKQLRQ